MSANRPIKSEKNLILRENKAVFKHQLVNLEAILKRICDIDYAENYVRKTMSIELHEKLSSLPSSFCLTRKTIYFHLNSRPSINCILTCSRSLISILYFDLKIILY